MPIAELPDWIYERIKPAPVVAMIERKRGNGNINLPPPCLTSCLNACAWLRHCRDDAVTLGEWEWHLMLGIVARCVDGIQMAHNWSKPHPKYTAKETDERITRLMKVGPATCANIQRTTTSYCSGCRTRSISPITAGYRIEEPPPPWEEQ